MNDDNVLNQDIEIEELIYDEIDSKVNKIYGKHFTQMTKDERNYLLLLKSKSLRRGVSFAKHALDRMDERFIKEKDVLRALKNGQIIDYRNIQNTDVITVRGCYVNKRDEQVYVVFSLTKRTIITTYSNKQYSAYKKMQHTEKYEKDFKIEIPEYYKRQINFYF